MIKTIGEPLGGIAFFVALISVYVSAIGLAGPLGLVLGWIPAVFVAVIAFGAFRYLWPVGLLIVPFALMLS